LRKGFPLEQPGPAERQLVSAVEAENQTAPLVDERNLEYQRRRLALGDNPIKEEIDAVWEFRLELHRKQFQAFTDNAILP